MVLWITMMLEMPKKLFVKWTERLLTVLALLLKSPKEDGIEKGTEIETATEGVIETEIEIETETEEVTEIEAEHQESASVAGRKVIGLEIAQKKVAETDASTVDVLDIWPENARRRRECVTILTSNRKKVEEIVLALVHAQDQEDQDPDPEIEDLLTTALLVLVLDLHNVREHHHHVLPEEALRHTAQRITAMAMISHILLNCSPNLSILT